MEPVYGGRLGRAQCHGHRSGAEIIAYIDDFKLLMILTLLALPLCLFFRKPPADAGSDPAVPAH